MNTSPYAFQQADSKEVHLWISPETTMAEIQRFVGIMGVFEAKGGTDPLQFSLTPKKGVKARLLYHSNVTVVRPLPHPRFSHPTTGKRIIRLSEAIALSRVLQGIPDGEKLTVRTKYLSINSKTQC